MPRVPKRIADASIPASIRPLTLFSHIPSVVASLANESKSYSSINQQSKSQRFFRRVRVEVSPAIALLTFWKARSFWT